MKFTLEFQGVRATAVHGGHQAKHWILPQDPRDPYLKRVIATHAVYPRVLEFHDFDIQSPGQKSHFAPTPSEAMAMMSSRIPLVLTSRETLDSPPDPRDPYLKRVIATHAVYPCVLEFHDFDIQSPGQKSHFAPTPSEAMAMMSSRIPLVLTSRETLDSPPGLQGPLP